MIAISVFILFLYSLLLLWLVIGGIRLNRFRGSETNAGISFSIVIPFRNEREHLGALCNSLQKLDYPQDKFEILFVDDDSEDNSQSVINEHMNGTGIRWEILSNERRSGSPKKDAISKAVEHAAHQWILTTDADCLLPKELLIRYSKFIALRDPYMVCGPIVISSSWGGLQSLENLSLQGATIGCFGWKQPILCNGANLAFRSDIFESVGKYSGNDHIASGDDIFLMTKIQKKYPGKVNYLKDEKAIVATKGVKGLVNIIRQRIRWSKKTSRVKNPLMKVIGLLVFLTNLWLVLLVFRAIFDSHYLIPAVFVFGIKITIDNIYLQEVNRFFKRRIFSLLIILNGLLYPFISVLVVVLSLFGGYSWKGRYHRR